MKKLLVTSLTLVVALALATLFHGNAALARSNAHNQGYWNTRNVYMNGGYFDDFCGLEHSDTYFFDYKLGYRVGWTARTTNEEIEEICAKNTKPVALEKNESLLVSYTSYYRRGRAVPVTRPQPATMPMSWFRYGQRYE